MDMLGCYEQFPRYWRKWRLVISACCSAIPALWQDVRVRPVLEGIERTADAGAPAGRTAGEIVQRATEVGWVYNRDHDRVAQLIEQAIGAAFGAHDPYAAMDFLLAGLDGAFGERTREQCDFVREVFGNPFRSVPFSPNWRTDTAVTLARTMYEARDFGAMPILADALQDAGCDQPAILTHCRDTTLTHVRGCWVVDLVLGKS
jgi:hypothetical protein